MPIIFNSQPQLGKTKEYRLSIQADLNGFSFSIVDPNQNKLLFLYNSDFILEGGDMEHFSKKSSKLFKELPILTLPYKSVDILIGGPRFTAIPTSIHKHGKGIDTIKRLHHPDELDELHSFEIVAQRMVLLFLANSTLLHVINEHQPNSTIHHSVGTYLTYLPLYPEYNKLFFQYYKGYVIILACEGDRILHCTSYPAHHFNSALYFLLLTLKEVQFNPEQTTVFISGNLRESDFYDLSKYFSKIKFFRNPEIPLSSKEEELKYSTLLFDRGSILMHHNKTKR